MRKFLLYLLLILVIALSGLVLSPYLGEFLLNLGIISETVPISGTGSMYPTFPKSEGVSEQMASSQTVAQPKMKRFQTGITIFGRTFFSYQLQRGDIVEFENELTKKISGEKYGTVSGFVKRVIALPGSAIELRDGFVRVDGNILDEAYTAKPRSTYGGDNLADCQVKKIPEDSVFVLGDNRKASLDSRFEIGFVKLSDIHHVLPLNMQNGFKKNWRDTASDMQYAHTSTVDPEDFVRLLNNSRTSRNISPLNLREKLNRSSQIRGQTVLKTDDFSTEATKSGLTLEKSVKQAGYQNIVFAELLTRGYFETEELLENIFEFPESSRPLLSESYQDIGLSPVVGDVNGCPTQVIVIHLGGYKPPNYKKEDMESWKNLIDNISSILPSWENLKGAPGVNQEKLESLLNILNQRLINARKIYSRLTRNEWLTIEEESLVKEDNRLHEEAESLISELNK